MEPFDESYEVKAIGGGSHEHSIMKEVMVHGTKVFLLICILNLSVAMSSVRN
jgi:hypothetical protein